MYPGQVTRIVVRWAPTDIPAGTDPTSANFPFDPERRARLRLALPHRRSRGQRDDAAERGRAEQRGENVYQGKRLLDFLIPSALNPRPHLAALGVCGARLCEVWHLHPRKEAGWGKAVRSLPNVVERAWPFSPEEDTDHAVDIDHLSFWCSPRSRARRTRPPQDREGAAQLLRWGWIWQTAEVAIRRHRPGRVCESSRRRAVGGKTLLRTRRPRPRSPPSRRRSWPSRPPRRRSPGRRTRPAARPFWLRQRDGGGRHTAERRSVQDPDRGHGQDANPCGHGRLPVSGSSSTARSSTAPISAASRDVPGEQSHQSWTEVLQLMRSDRSGRWLSRPLSRTGARGSGPISGRTPRSSSRSNWSP